MAVVFDNSLFPFIEWISELSEGRDRVESLCSSVCSAVLKMLSSASPLTSLLLIFLIRMGFK